MNGQTVEQPTAWAEDKATVGTDLSADPGAKTEERAASSVARLSQTPFGIGTHAINPSRRSCESLPIQTPGDGLPVANNRPPKLHFTLNQHTLRLRTEPAGEGSPRCRDRQR